MHRSRFGRVGRALAVVSASAAMLAATRVAAADSARELMERGLALHEAGDYDGAIAAYRSVLALDPGSVDAQYELTYSTFLKGDYPGTIALAEKAIAASPK